MTTRTCGCTTETCGCCEGTQILTPVSTVNRPGLTALQYRAGTHAAFLETMKARLATMTVQAPGAVGQTLETFRPLKGLTARDADDPSIAMLDAWATVGDVLTFYQERIANEGYLGTAIERRSVLELARLVGYALRPGVASTVYLAYTLNDNQAVPVEIPPGTRSQSVPGPGELPQTFETSETLVARREWNNLQVRLTQPQKITSASAPTADSIFVAGTDLNLKAGAVLLLVFGDNSDEFLVRTIADVEVQFESQRTKISLSPLPPAILTALPVLAGFIELMERKIPAGSSGQDSFSRTGRVAQSILDNIYLGVYLAPERWPEHIENITDVGSESDAGELIADFSVAIKTVLKARKTTSASAALTDPSQIAGSLLVPFVAQAPNSLQLSRSLGSIFDSGADVHAQMLVNFAPRLQDSFYTAWSNAAINPASAELKALYAFRTEAPLFGANAARLPAYTTDAEGNRVPLPPEKWSDWPIDNSEGDKFLFMDKSYDGLSGSGYAIVKTSNVEGPLTLLERVAAANTVQRTAYGISGKTTKLEFADAWWLLASAGGSHPIGLSLLVSPGEFTAVRDMPTLRNTLVLAQSEELTLVDEPIVANVEVTKGQPEIQLDRLYDGLTSGRWVILSGERSDITGVTGVQASELVMVSGLRQDFDAKLPGDQTRTTLILATTTAYSYKRDKLTIYGNVVKATHGETRNEILGSGDGSRSLQSFALKQPPLTFVPAPTPAGVDSTLKVYVNDVQWSEADTLAGLGPKDRNFITKTDDKDTTTVIFGNGEEGARLPTGVENVKAVYRNGIGQPGNVAAGTISTLLTRPLGVQNVINPLRASGGADREKIDLARENASLAVMSLDRLVSVQDYADFTRTFAGIGKAASRRLSDGRRELVHVTIAGADDIPIDPVSDLYRNLVAALRKFGDPALPVQVQVRELLVLLVSAKVRLLAAYQWEPVAVKIRAAILDAFGFQRRSLGQPALLCEVIGLIQNIEGVDYVDVDAFGAVPEKIANLDGTRRLLSLEEMAKAVLDFLSIELGNPIVAGGENRQTRALRIAKPPAQRVDANLADFENGALRPAQLAIFTPSVPDTIVLNRIL